MKVFQLLADPFLSIFGCNNNILYVYKPILPFEESVRVLVGTDVEPVTALGLRRLLGAAEEHGRPQVLG